MPRSSFAHVGASLAVLLCASCSTERPLAGAAGFGTAPIDPGGEGTPTPPGATGTLVHLHGRFDLRDATAPRCAWTGCGLSTRVDGAALDLVLGGSPGIRFQVVVDGAPTTVLTSGTVTTTFHVADGLPPGQHDVAIFRMSEALFGDAIFSGFVPASGSQLVPTPEPSRRLEIIGDSISAGYGNQGCPFSPATENGYLTWGATAARDVDADLHLEARSGIGMYRSGSPQIPTMPAVFPRALLDDPSTSWLFPTWIPDAVVINLGTNDFILGDPGQPFNDAYVAFLQSLRSRYPHALILCATNGKPTIAARVDQVVAAVHDPLVQRLDFLVPDWSGCDGHPSVAADQAMATQLVERLQAELGW